LEWRLRAAPGQSLCEHWSTAVEELESALGVAGSAREHRKRLEARVAELERRLVTSSHRATDLDRIAELEAEIVERDRLLAVCRDNPREEDAARIEDRVKELEGKLALAQHDDPRTYRLEALDGS
jgi:hypothetical protein